VFGPFMAPKSWVCTVEGGPVLVQLGKDGADLALIKSLVRARARVCSKIASMVQLCLSK
jgi:hypothetical protein